MLNPNSVAVKQDELVSRQHHASVPLLRAAPKLACPHPPWLSLRGTRSYTLSVSERKILVFYHPGSGGAAPPHVLCVTYGGMNYRGPLTKGDS